MRQETVNIYAFNELSEDIKEKVIEKFRYINVEFDDLWFQNVYDEAEDIGIKITGFDLDRGRCLEARLINDMVDICQAIKENHDEACGTYKVAIEYLDKYNNLVHKHSNGECNGEKVAEENIEAFDNELDEIIEEFKNDIFNEYLSILDKEYEYQISDECIIETIDANGFEFNEKGKRY